MPSVSEPRGWGWMVVVAQLPPHPPFYPPLHQHPRQSGTQDTHLHPKVTNQLSVVDSLLSLMHFKHTVIQSPWCGVKVNNIPKSNLRLFTNGEIFNSVYTDDIEIIASICHVSYLICLPLLFLLLYSNQRLCFFLQYVHKLDNLYQQFRF